LEVLRMTDKPWIASYPEDIQWDQEILPELVHVAMDRAVAAYPTRPCIDFLGRKYSYAEIGALVDQAAAGLQALGVKKGDRVGVFLPNTPFFVISYYGALKAGAIVVNFNPLYSQPEVERQARDSGCRVMITLDMTLMLPKLAGLVASGDLEKVVVCKFTDALPFPKGLLFSLLKRGSLAKVPNAPAYVPFDALLKSGTVLRSVALNPREDLAVLQYTGGTTGIPKGAMLTHANVSANRSQVRSWDPRLIDGEERMLSVLPFFHVFAMTVAMNLAVAIAAEMILLPRFELQDLLRVIDRKKPTLFPAVPTIFNAINSHPDIARYDLSSLNFCISGGAPLPLEVKQAFEARTGCRVVEGYGLSEASPVVTCNPVFGLNKPNSIGLPFVGTEVEVRDLEDSRTCVPLGENGEICIKGPQVIKGYWKKHDATAATLRDGWLHTGDVGYMDEDGYVFLVDRIKDVILCGGYKVYPRIVEEALYEHPDVVEVTVIGIPDSYRGQSPKAFVKLREGHQGTDAETLLAFLSARLSPIELPREVEFRDSLPKTMIGKLSKKELIAEEAAKRANDHA
jgi:long-chain acyl-CoA synthetase